MSEPLLMVSTASQWLGPARMARALARADCEVSLLAPSALRLFLRLRRRCRVEARHLVLVGVSQPTVNHPLRLSQANVHLLGHGYAPILRYTDRFGEQQTKIVPFLPRDQMLTSEGVAQFPDVNIDPKTNARNEDLQVAFEGVFLPTVDPKGGVTSVFPAERDPVLYLSAYRGNLGVDAGLPGSVYALDRAQLANGQLKKVGAERPQRLAVGQSWTLDDGTKLEFLGTRPYATLATLAGSPIFTVEHQSTVPV